MVGAARGVRARPHPSREPRAGAAGGRERALRRRRPPRPREASSGRRRTRRRSRPPRPRRCAPWRRPAWPSRSTPAGCASPSAGPFPAPALLAEAHGLGIPLVLGSDAHRPGDVGHGFDHAAALARAAGYTELRSIASGVPEALRVTAAGRRLAAIFNPHSGGGGYKRDVPLIFDALRGLGYVVEELETDRARRRQAPRPRGGRRRVRPRLRRRRRRHRQRDHQRPRRQRRPARHHPHRHRQRAGHGARHPARAAGRGQAPRVRHRLAGSTSGWPATATSASWPAWAWTPPWSPPCTRR